jgi:tRNA(Ile)-lysidine synthase
VEAALAFAASDESGVLELPGGRLRRERGRLYPDSGGTIPELPERELPEEGVLELPEAGLVLRCERSVKGEEINGLFKTYELKCEKISGKLICSGRRDGDRFHPLGRGCGKSLKALFGEAGLTRRERARVPVLRDEEGILAVLGFGQDVRSAARIGDPVIRVTWTEEAE